MILDGHRIAGDSMWSPGDADAVVRRVWVATPVVGAVSAAIAAGIGGWRDATGVAVGVLLAMVNFRSLHNSLRAILDAGHERAPSGTTLMFVFRWIIVATAAFGLYRTGVASVTGIFTGLFAPAIAVGLEAAYQTVHALRGAAADDDK
jgi:hypothetical protein